MKRNWHRACLQRWVWPLTAIARKKAAFLLSGSSSPQLVSQMSESLAGRVARAEMAPLSLSEAWQQAPSKLYSLLTQGAPLADVMAAAAPNLSAQQISSYWFTGGYPEPWLGTSDEFRTPVAAQRLT